MSRCLRLSTLGLCLGLALALALGPGCARPLGPVIRVARGEPAPDEIGVTPGGERIQLAQFRGKLVLLNFWTTWCAPCRMELPRLEEFHRAYQDKGLEVVAVNYGETEEQVREFLKANSQLTLRVVLDPYAETAQRFGVSGLPTTVIIDGNGVVRWARNGYDGAYRKQLLEQLNALVAEQSSPEAAPAPLTASPTE